LRGERVMYGEGGGITHAVHDTQHALSSSGGDSDVDISRAAGLR
jgi:hypothetical protein